MNEDTKRVRIIRPGDYDGIVIPVKSWSLVYGCISLVHPDGSREVYGPGGWLRVMEVDS